MRIPTMLRNSMFATGLILAFAAVPCGQAMAQTPPPTQMPSNATPMQTPDTAMQEKMSENRTVPDKAADAWITTKVKSEFGTTKGIKATNISVSTNDGVVTLTGKVASEAEKNHAERVARHVKGVKSVDGSGLTVGSTPSSEK